MPKVLIPFVFLLAATSLEATGDALIRMGLGAQAWGMRGALFAVGAALLFGYGALLNLAPLEFGRVVGLYIATLFVVWQVVNAIAFRAAPSAPVWIGGALIVAGGLIVSFWRAAAAT
jgi:small multidrug resistance family-3 protein